MNIAVIGAGRVGTALGEKWKLKGHNVIYGSRSAEKHDENKIFSQREAVSRSEVVVLAVPGNALIDLASSLDLSNKLVIDTTNSPNSGMNDVMPHAPLAKWVKAFNTIGYNIMENPVFGQENADGYFCTDHEDAVKIATELIEDIGLNPVHIGNSTMAKDLENLAWIWIKMARGTGNREFAFKIIKR